MTDEASNRSFLRQRSEFLLYNNNCRISIREYPSKQRILRTFCRYKPLQADKQTNRSKAKVRRQAHLPQMHREKCGVSLYSLLKC